MLKNDGFLLIKEAARFLGVCTNTLRNWERQKKIVVYRNRFNKYRVYKIEELEKILQSIKPVEFSHEVRDTNNSDSMGKAPIQQFDKGVL
jgi:phage antirepressor YoqD-like protein